MPNSLTIFGQTFSSQAEAERFFYGLRDQNLGTGSDIVDSIEFNLLFDLYVRYCEVTSYSTPGDPVAFYARNIARGVGPDGGTTQGFVAKFGDGTEVEFSIRKAVKAVAA